MVILKQCFYTKFKAFVPMVKTIFVEEKLNYKTIPVCKFFKFFSVYKINYKVIFYKTLSTNPLK